MSPKLTQIDVWSGEIQANRAARLLTAEANRCGVDVPRIRHPPTRNYSFVKDYKQTPW